jgi:hypothetical protein
MKKILIIEDDKIIKGIIEFILKKEEQSIVNAAHFDFNQFNLTKNIQKPLNKEQSIESVNFFLDDHVRLRRQVETKQNVAKTKEIMSKKRVNRKLHFNRLEKLNVSFFDAIASDTPPSPLTKQPSLSYNDSYSHSNFTPSLTNNTDINSQSVFLTWMYHTLWRKKPKLLKFRNSIAMENESRVYSAIDYYERLQNQSSYYKL